MPTERSSQTAGPATREEEKKKVFIAKCAPTGRNKTTYMGEGSADVDGSTRATHPILLWFHVELIADPGQRMDSFGQHWTVRSS